MDDFFAGHAESRAIFDAVRAAVDALGDAEARVTKSQVSFRRKRAFAWAWMPDMYLQGHHAPLVLTLALHRRDDSPRWKEIVEPYPGRFTHHLELRSPENVNPQVRQWLTEAWEHAG